MRSPKEQQQIDDLFLVCGSWCFIPIEDRQEDVRHERV